MRKQRFSGILILMAISLMGIILIQMFWIKKAISVKEEQFSHQVNIALNNASYRIERNRNAFYISSFMSGISNELLDSDKMENLTDSLILSLGNFYNKSSSKPVVVNPSNIQITKGKDGNQEVVTYSFDTIIEDGNFSQRIQTYHSVTSPDEASKQQIKNQNKDFLQPEIPAEEVREQLHNLVGQMLFEINIKDVPIEERVDYSVLGPTLSYELRNAGIFLPFEFAVVNATGKANSKLSSKGFKSADKTHILKLPFSLMKLCPILTNWLYSFPAG
jgi:two-component system, OmpR family, phosphate regulon sensor histidine kinase PhoR